MSGGSFIPEVEDVNTGILLIGLACVMLANQVLSLIKEVVREWLKRKTMKRDVGGPENAVIQTLHEMSAKFGELSENIKKRPPYPACFYDKKHFDRVATIEEKVEMMERRQASSRRFQKWLQQQVTEGRFKCKLDKDHLRTLERLEDDQKKRDPEV